MRKVFATFELITWVAVIVYAWSPAKGSDCSYGSWSDLGNVGLATSGRQQAVAPGEMKTGRQDMLVVPFFFFLFFSGFDSQ